MFVCNQQIFELLGACVGTEHEALIPFFRVGCHNNSRMPEPHKYFATVPAAR